METWGGLTRKLVYQHAQGFHAGHCSPKPMSGLEDGHPEMAACCFGADDRFDVGNIEKIGFMGAWNSEPMKAMREAHRYAR